MQTSGATCDARAMYARVRRWRDASKQQEESDGTLSTPSSLSTFNSMSSTSSITSDSRGTSHQADVRETTLKSLLPTWMDVDKTAVSMSKRKRRSSTQYSVDLFNKKMDGKYYDERFKIAFKAATSEVGKFQENPSLHGKRGNGICAVVQKYNNEMLSSPNDRKLTKGGIQHAIERGDFGISPPKRGRKVSIPSELPYALAVHSTMMQVAGEGEASSLNIQAVASALVAGSVHEDKTNIDYLWRFTRSLHPEILIPVTAKNHEDRRVDWLSYKNIVDWNLRAKKFLVDIGMAEDSPGIIREYYLFILTNPPMMD